MKPNEFFIGLNILNTFTGNCFFIKNIRWKFANYLGRLILIYNIIYGFYETSNYFKLDLSIAPALIMPSQILLTIFLTLHLGFNKTKLASSLELISKIIDNDSKRFLQKLSLIIISINLTTQIATYCFWAMVVPVSLTQKVFYFPSFFQCYPLMANGCNYLYFVYCIKLIDIHYYKELKQRLQNKSHIDYKKEIIKLRSINSLKCQLDECINFMPF